MTSSNKKKGTGDVEIIEMSAGDFIKTGLTGIQSDRFDEDIIDRLYGESLKIYRKVREEYNPHDKRHLCGACVVMAGRKEQEFISTSEVSNAFALERGKVSSLTYKVMERTKDDFDLQEPPVESYFNYYLDGLTETGIITQEEKDLLRRKFQLCASRLDEKQKRDFHHGFQPIMNNSNRMLAGGFLKFINDHFIEENLVTQEEIGHIVGSSAASIRRVIKGLEKIDDLKELDSYMEKDDE